MVTMLKGLKNLTVDCFFFFFHAKTVRHLCELNIMEGNSSDGQETYEGTTKKRPRKLDTSGTGDYCCIPNCKSSTLDKNQEKTGIGFFTFPKDEALKRIWLQRLKTYRKDKVVIKRNTKVCEFHFEISCIKFYEKGKKTLKPGSIPTLFDFRPQTVTRKRKSPTKRIALTNKPSHHSSSESVLESPTTDSRTQCQDCEILQKEVEKLKNENSRLQKENDELKNELQTYSSNIASYETKNRSLEDNIYNYNNISRNKDVFRKATGIELDAFEQLYDFLEPGDDCENINLTHKDESILQSPTSTKKQGPKPKHNAREQLFICLTWL